MLKQAILSASVGVLAAACAAGPTASGPSASTSTPQPVAPLVQQGLNIAATTQWMAEERLLPQQPILALVGQGGSVDKPAGVSMTCNPDNGAIKGRLGKQAAARVGQSARYTLRLGAQAKTLDGVFQAGGTAGEADFVFDMDAVTLRQMGQLDVASFVSDQGQVEWALVRDPAAQVSAKTVASLKNLNAEAQSWMTYCNPK
jgi:hypothetical protein